MPSIPGYNDWMRSTATLFTPRSTELKNIDTALEEYWRGFTVEERNAKSRLLTRALTEWIGTKGPNWRKSDRNKGPRFIVEELYNALNARVLTQADLDAFDYQDEQRRKRLLAVFADKEIVWKGMHTAHQLKAANEEFKKNVLGAWQPNQKSVNQIRDARTRMTNAAKDRNDYKPGKWQMGRDVGGSLMSAGAGIASIQTGNLNWPAQRSFGLGGIASSTRDFHTMLQDLCGGANPSEISWHFMQTLGLDVQKLAADVTPIVSNVFSGTKVLLAWGKVCLAEYRMRQVAKKSDFFVPEGDVSVAFKALQELLDRVTWSEGVQAGLQTADFATRTILSFTDGGAVSSTAVGVASTIAQLLHRLALFGREYAETRAARKLLDDRNNLDTRLFSTYPLLGCYMLLCSDTSEIVNMVRHARKGNNAVRFGDLAWQNEIEWVKKQGLDPVLERAAALVQSSPFLLRDRWTKQGMPVHAAYGVGGLDKMSQKLSKVAFAVDAVNLGGQFV
jgi:hypothetical protein